jgi:hypothetical protein
VTRERAPRAHPENPVILAPLQPWLSEPDRVAEIKGQICKFFECHADGRKPETRNQLLVALYGMQDETFGV